MFDKLLIGREIEILTALDKSLIGKNGTVLDETRNTLVIWVHQGKIVRIPKNVVRIRMREGSREIVVEGGMVQGTQIERIRG